MMLIPQWVRNHPILHSKSAGQFASNGGLQAMQLLVFGVRTKPASVLVRRSGTRTFFSRCDHFNGAVGWTVTETIGRAVINPRAIRQLSRFP